MAHKSKDILTLFFHAVKADSRLSPNHISVYFVLFKYWLANNEQNPINISRKKIMDYTKIKSTATYHKVMKELTKFGYIDYLPSYHPATATTIFLKAYI